MISGQQKRKEMEQMDASKFILAMYDIRGKQSYIYKSTKMKEIVGASLIIRDCFLDYLFPAAEQVMTELDGQSVKSRGIFSYRTIKRDGRFCYKKEEEAAADPFSEENFLRHLEEGYIGEVVYDGGGNFQVLYRDVESYREVNRRFYVDLLKGTYSLKVLTSYVGDVHFDDYGEDRKRLYEIHRRNEHLECAMPPVNALPIVQVDPGTCLPLGDKLMPSQAQGRKDEKVSLESKAKYDKYDNSVDSRTEGARVLDTLITGKGIDSHLAVIYIDGNSMGAKVQAATKGCKSYQESVAKLRKFSARIQREYIDQPMREIDQYFEEKVRNEKEAKQKRRFVIYAGDEINFICNASEAYEIVEKYFEALNRNSSGDDVNSSCAGVAIFHSHAPYAEAYRIAEECCETGKRLMKEEKITSACFLDFHYCQGAIGTSLEDIREHEGTAELCAPWRLDKFEGGAKEGDKKDTEKDAEEDAEKENENPTKYSADDVKDLKKLLNSIARSNGKTLMAAAKAGKEEFRLELERIKAHTADSGVKEQLDKILKNPEAKRALVYRMMTVYDLWFRNSAEGGEKE